MSSVNPRFPHSLVIRRSVSADSGDPFNRSSDTTDTLYEGVCRSYRNVMTKTRAGVLVSDYVIAMPRASFAILPGDRLTVTANNRTMEGKVVDSQTTNFGTNIWWNKKEN